MKKIYFLLLVFCFGFSSFGQIVNIPDANFKARLLAASSTVQVTKNLAGVYFKVDSNNDGEIQQSEASEVSYLTVTSASISSIVGINSFNNIVFFYCFNNQLTTANISGLNFLKTIDCSINPLMSSVNLSNLNSLETLYVENGNLVTLNLNSITSIKNLFCTDNNLTTLDVSGFTNLISLYCSQNNLSTLDISNCTNLNILNCTQNNLSSLFIKNGKIENSLAFSGNANLNYVCVDDGQLTTVQNQINGYGYINCFANSYCSFTPGGVFYQIQGNAKYDANNNGCDEMDIIYPNLKLNLNSNSQVGTIISNNSGLYSIPVSSGVHTITPIIENSSYYSISSSPGIINFPNTASPYTQNFCFLPNGNHNDLEIILIPTEIARPGFDANYKLIYKNKGTTSQTGTVNLIFDDAVLDLVTANPTITSQTTNSLSWTFVGLLPFETREIRFTLNVNSPLETPAVNSGTILNYSATISSGIDETPNDNAFILNQTVVNSFDPNDKTCLEGATISPDKVGQYVHYLIRFENTGTANAQNIVIKDIIDTTKFDVSTLVPINGSHSFVTRISENNKVEFIFENIQLPFDDANNDGYVAFKIKTKSTLVLGNTFSNTAGIYFDYNFPIITNNYTTTVAVLSNQDFDFSKYLSLFPNPAKEVLNIETKNAIEVSSMSIYNVLGQLILVLPNAEETRSIDTSDLTTGTYFLKIASDKGTASTKFIKD